MYGYGHSQLGRWLGGQLPRRVSGGICGVAAGHAESEEQAGEFEVKGFKGGEKEKQQRGREGVGRGKCLRGKRELGPLRDVIALGFVFYICLLYIILCVYYLYMLANIRTVGFSSKKQNKITILP